MLSNLFIFENESKLERNKRKEMCICVYVISVSYINNSCNNQASGNIDIEDVDSTNACYGGTTTLFKCVNCFGNKCGGFLFHWTTCFVDYAS